ncbi:hypothetical protein GOODEAATRI_031945 [Goodea atripinnis]|uniref:Uncharacterized protein n=1 Tax=Goodea atripinnis TaxID=208336 RepID=A0ABV0NRG2_9TELE
MQLSPQLTTMFGMMETGVLGASVVLAGGVAYLIWNYASSAKQKKLDTQPGEDCRNNREEEKVEEKREKKAPVEETFVPVKAPTTATVKVTFANCGVLRNLATFYLFKRPLNNNSSLLSN